VHHEAADRTCSPLWYSVAGLLPGGSTGLIGKLLAPVTKGAWPAPMLAYAYFQSRRPEAVPQCPFGTSTPMAHKSRIPYALRAGRGMVSQQWNHSWP